MEEEKIEQAEAKVEETEAKTEVAEESVKETKAEAKKETKSKKKEEKVESEEAKTEPEVKTEAEVKVEEKETETETEVKTEESEAEAEAEVAEEEYTDKFSKKRDSRKPKSRRKKVETKEEKPQSEWIERVVQIRRVTKVVKGGKKLSFRAIVIVGNKKGQVGVGCAKAAEVIIAIQKAITDGRKNLITVPIFKTTIPHPITGRSGAGNVMLRPASQGTGIIAGGAVRQVLELAGIENILSKSLGSKSPLNAANATLDALKSLRPFSKVAKSRGKTVAEILN